MVIHFTLFLLLIQPVEGFGLFFVKDQFWSFVNATNGLFGLKPIHMADEASSILAVAVTALGVMYYIGEHIVAVLFLRVFSLWCRR